MKRIASPVRLCYDGEAMRVLIVSDIHANLVALETVLNAAAGEYDSLWCLGDVVGYGPRPNECIELVRERATLCVMGNHDWAVLGREGINVDDFNPHARQAVLWTRDELTPENKSFLEQMPHLPQRPDVPQYPDRSANILVTHASPREPVWEYILTPSIALENFGIFSEEICLVGHTHKPAIFRLRLDADAGSAEPEECLATVDYLQPKAGTTIRMETSPVRRLIINPGSVGQPRDNDPRAAYAILDMAEWSWQYERVSYPVELTQGQMRSAELPKRLIDRLSFGW
jgi:predicted phosphodiesterase